MMMVSMVMMMVSMVMMMIMMISGDDDNDDDNSVGMVMIDFALAFTRNTPANVAHRQWLFFEQAMRKLSRFL